MADEKGAGAVAAEKEKTYEIFNRSVARRKFVVIDASGKKFDLMPGKTAVVGEKQYNLLKQYTDIIDADQMAPKRAAKLSELESENAELKKQLAELRGKGDSSELLAKLKSAKSLKEVRDLLGEHEDGSPA